MGSLSMICTRLTYKNSWLSLSTDNSLIQEEWIIENNSKVYHNHLTQAARTMSVMFMYIECIFLRFNNWVFFNFIPETYIIIANKELYNWSRLGNTHVTYIYICFRKIKDHWSPRVVYNLDIHTPKDMWIWWTSGSLKELMFRSSTSMLFFPIFVLP